MRIGILQPGYLPWLGFFEQVYKSDVFIIYDDVQYDKHGWRNRNRIKSANGIQWLTVPVLTTGKNKPLIKDVMIDNHLNWQKKHITSIRNNYGKAEYFKDYIEIFDKVYSKKWDFLIDLDIELIDRLCKALGLNRQIRFSSELGICGDRIQRLIGICKLFNADVFYEGESGKNYIDEENFKNEGITIEYQTYHHPTYKQLYGDFIPYMSIIDLLFNEGDKSLQILSGITENQEERQI